MYAALGHFCLLCGGALLFVSANRSLIKQLVPVLAPHVVQVDLLLGAVDSLDLGQLVAAFKRHTSAMVSAAARDTTATNAQEQQSQDQQETFTSAQVEELPDLPAAASATPSAVPFSPAPAAPVHVKQAFAVPGGITSPEQWNSEFEEEEEVVLGRSESFFRDAAEYVFAEQQASSKSSSPLQSEQKDSFSTLRKRK